MNKFRIITTILFLNLLFLSQFVYSQKECKVLVEDLVGTYDGRCKKGLAHGKGEAIGTDRYKGAFSKGFPKGKGTYTWANGDVYTGQWKKGKRDGEGKFTFTINEKDTVLDGLWRNDKYLGPKPLPPKIIMKRSVDRYSIKKIGNDKNRVLISFKQNGMRNPNISGLLITSSGGIETSVGYLTGYEKINFPINIKLRYKTKNKLLTSEYDVEFEFVISEPGDWIVEIHN